MPANAAIYLSQENVDLKEVFPHAVSDGNRARQASYFEVSFEADTVRYNIMPKAELAEHLNGFLGYVGTLSDEAQRLEDAALIISETQLVLGVNADKEFSDNNAIWQSLFQIADAFDGFIFVRDSIVLSTGAILVGPLRALDMEDDQEPESADVESN